MLNDLTIIWKELSVMLSQNAVLSDDIRRKSDKRVGKK